MQLCTFIVLLQQCLYSSHELGNDNVRSRNDVVDVDVEMMLRTADWEWEIQNRREVLMRCCKEKHTIYLSSRQEPGCFVTDVMMSPLSRAALQQCHKCLLATLLQMSWGCHDVQHLFTSPAWQFVTQRYPWHPPDGTGGVWSALSHSPAPTLITNIR